MTSKNIVISFLDSEKLPKHEFDDLVTVVEAIEGFEKKDINWVLQWFRVLHTIETTGWRTKESTQKIAKLLIQSKATGSPITFYSLFCPSYKKGEGEHGFRTDDIGETTKWAIKTLLDVDKTTRKMGFATYPPVAIFFDLALEQPEKTAQELDDLEKNIENFKKYLPKESDLHFYKLSEIFPHLKDVIGYHGVKLNPLPVDADVYARVVERGNKFYELFGWKYEQVLERSEIICSSEALVGHELRRHFPQGIMVYTPTMLERAQVYSGRNQKDPLPIIFPKHE